MDGQHCDHSQKLETSEVDHPHGLESSRRSGFSEFRSSCLGQGLHFPRKLRLPRTIPGNALNSLKQTSTSFGAKLAHSEVAENTARADLEIDLKWFGATRLTKICRDCMHHARVGDGFAESDLKRRRGKLQSQFNLKVLILTPFVLRIVYDKSRTAGSDSFN